MLFRLMSLIMALLFVLVVGCTSTKTTDMFIKEREYDADLLKAMKNWEGHHISQLVQRLGPPTQKVSDEIGGIIYIWRVDPNSLPYLPPPEYIQRPQTPSLAGTLLYHQRVANQRQHYNKMNRSRQRLLAMKRMFYVRPDGTIYHAQLIYQ